MHCRACEIRLDPDDNYCRNCGAPVRVLEVTTVSDRGDLVKVGPSAPALLAGAARPIATGAAAVAAGALVRFAVRQAVRGLVGGRRPKPVRMSRAIVPAQPQPPPTMVQVTEVIWYRRFTRT